MTCLTFISLYYYLLLRNILLPELRTTWWYVLLWLLLPSIPLLQLLIPLLGLHRSLIATRKVSLTLNLFMFRPLFTARLLQFKAAWR